MDYGWIVKYKTQSVCSRDRELVHNGSRFWDVVAMDKSFFFLKKTYFTFIFYKVAFCQLFIKVMMDDGWMAVQSAVF